MHKLFLSQAEKSKVLMVFFAINCTIPTRFFVQRKQRIVTVVKQTCSKQLELQLFRHLHLKEISI